MQNKPKLIAFDVDGTLLTSSHAVSTLTRQALGQLAHDDHYVLLATARPPKSVAEIAAQLGIDHTISIALNGAMIIRDNKILWDVPMERFAVKEIIQESRQWGLHANLMAGWDWLVEESGYWCEQEAAIVGFEPETVADLTADSMPDAHKVLFMGNAEDIAAYREWAECRSLPLSISLSKPTYCEIVSADVSKAHALHQVAQMLEIPLSDVIAFGDGENDREIVEMAGIGVAMGNAMPEVLAVADLVTKSNDDNGIYHALVEMGFVKPST